MALMRHTLFCIMLLCANLASDAFSPITPVVNSRLILPKALHSMSPLTNSAKSPPPLLSRISAYLNTPDPMTAQTPNRQLSSLVRITLPSIVAGFIAYATFPAFAIKLATIVNNAGVFAVLSQDSSQFVQNFLTVGGLLFSIIGEMTEREERPKKRHEACPKQPPQNARSVHPFRPVCFILASPPFAPFTPLSPPFARPPPFILTSCLRQLARRSILCTSSRSPCTMRYSRK